MISFVYPYLLYLLFLVPALGALFWWARSARNRKLRKFGNPQVLASLMPEASRYMPWVKLSLSLIVVALLVIILARPRATGAIEQTARETEQSRGIEIMICLDVSNSMLASATDDPQGIARLDRAKHLLEQLIKKMRDDKIGLIVFAGDAYTQLPITADRISAQMFVNGVSPEMVPTQGTAIGAAIDMAMDSFTPDDKGGKAIVIITDGENFEDDAVQSARRAASAGIQVDVIGLGSGKGAPIILNRKTNEYMKDYSGNQIITRLNEEQAQKIASAGKGIYISGSSNTAIADLDAKLDTLAKSDFMRTTLSPRAEQFPVFAWLALIFMIIEAITVSRKISWLRKINFFTAAKPGKTAKLIVIALAAATTLTACTDSTPEQRQARRLVAEGNEHYNADRYKDAEAAYTKAVNADPANLEAKYNLALSMIKQAGPGESGKQIMDNARKLLTEVMESGADAAKPLASKAAYNIGNMAYNTQQWGPAIEAYKQSLRFDPLYDDARENLRLAQLKRDNQDQNQDNQNQDKDKDKDKQDQDKDQQKQDQNKQDQNQQNQDNQNQNQDQKPQQPQQPQGGISDQNAEKILKAMENEEAATRRRVQEAEKRKAAASGRRVVTNPW